MECVKEEVKTEVEEKEYVNDFPQEKVHRHVVAWSGGLDSTALLLHLYEQGIKEVYTISVDCPYINPDMRESEEKAREVLKEKLPMKIHETVLRIDTPVFDTGWYLGEHRDLFQPLQVLHLLSIVSQIGNDFTLHLGYLTTDSIATCIYKIEELFKNATSVTGVQGNIEFPFRLCDKSDIVRYMLDRWPDIMPYVSYCEISKPGEVCNECNSCDTMINALIKVNNDKSLDFLQTVHGLYFESNRESIDSTCYRFLNIGQTLI